MNKLWLIPIISIIIIIGAAVAAQGSINLGVSQSKQALTVTNLNTSINESAYTDYKTITITGDLTSTQSFKYLQASVKWFDSSGAIIKTDSIGWTVTDVQQNQVYKFKINYFDKTKPAKAQIDFSKGSIGDNTTLLSITVDIK